MSALKRFFKGLPTKKIVYSFVLSGFLLISIVPKSVVAGVKTDGGDTWSYSQHKVAETESPKTIPEKNSKTKGVELENGQVLSEELALRICGSNPVPGWIPVVGGGRWCLPEIPGPDFDIDVTNPFNTAFSGANTVIKQGLKWFAEHVLKILFEITLKVVLYITNIFAAVLGLNTANACEEPNITSEEKETCEGMRNAIAQIDPLFADTSGIASRFNLFVLADSAYSSLYQNFPGISTPKYLAYELKDNILGAKTVQAQGAGTNSFGGGIREVWGKMRDIAIVAMVLVVIVVGFMIMFRKKLDPRTSVTAANSLPRIVIAFILIFFSFAISGLFIDFIYISVNIIRNYLGGTGGNFADAYNRMSETAGGELTWLPFFTFMSNSVLNWGGILTFMSAGLIGVGGAILIFGTNPVGWITIAIIILAVLGLDLLIRIIMFILAILLFWALLKRFVMMLLLTIFSPFFFLMGAIPGFEGVTINWAKRMLSSALTFPAILVIIYVAVYLIGGIEWRFLASGFIPATDAGVNPPPPIGPAGKFVNLSVLAGIGVLFFASQIPNAIDDMLGIRPTSGRGFGPGSVIGGVMGGIATGGRAFSTIRDVRGSAFMQRMFWSQSPERDRGGRPIPGTGVRAPIARLPFVRRFFAGGGGRMDIGPPAATDTATDPTGGSSTPPIRPGR